MYIIFLGFSLHWSHNCYLSKKIIIIIIYISSFFLSHHLVTNFHYFHRGCHCGCCYTCAQVNGESEGQFLSLIQLIHSFTWTVDKFIKKTLHKSGLISLNCAYKYPHVEFISLCWQFFGCVHSFGCIGALLFHSVFHNGNFWPLVSGHISTSLVSFLLSNLSGIAQCEKMMKTNWNNYLFAY